MLYLRTQDELLVEVRARLRDGGGDRWSTTEVWRNLNRALEGWHGRVSAPAVYVITGGWPTDEFEITLPDWIPDEVQPQAQWPVDPLLPNDQNLSTWKDISKWLVEPAEDGTRTLRLSVVPYNATARLLYHITNGPVPTTLPTINAELSSSATTVTLASAINVAPVGYIKIDAEWLLYRGVTRGSATTTLENLVRAQYDTTAATHASGATAYWGVAAPNNLVYVQLLDQACAYMHELYLTDGSPKERDLHERMLSYYQSKADQFWRRHANVKAPRWKPYVMLLVAAWLLSGCIFHGYVEPITIYDKPTETPTAEVTATPTPDPMPTPDSPLPTPTLTATSPVTLTIQSDAEDMHQWLSGIELSAWPAWLGYWSGGTENAGWRFVDVPGTAVEQATLRLRGTHGDGLNLDVRVHAVALDDALPWAPGTDMLSLPVTSAYTTITDVRVGQWHEMDVTAQINEVMSRPGWSPGNAVALLAISHTTGRNVAGGVVDYALNPLQVAQLVVVPVAPIPMAMAAPATFDYAELEQAAASVGIDLVPGAYSCEFAGDDYARCVIHEDGVPGGQVCVTADGIGACP